VAVEEQSTVPIAWNLHQVRRAVAERSGFCGEAGLSARGVCDGKNENRGDRDEKHGGLGLPPHFNSSYFRDVREAVAPAKRFAEGNLETAPAALSCWTAGDVFAAYSEI
jgi:hypothetical protein